MIKDRLAALKAAQHLDNGPNLAEGSGPTIGARETTVPITRTSSGPMLEFFEQVDDLRNSIDRIAELVAEVKVLHNEILSSPQADQRTKGVLEEKMNAIKQSANQVRKKLKGCSQIGSANHDRLFFRAENVQRGEIGGHRDELEPLLSSEQSRAKAAIPRSQAAGRASIGARTHADVRTGTTQGAHVGEYVSAFDRMRNAQLVALNIRFNEIMSDYNVEQLRYRDACKKQFMRQLEITGRTTTSDELEEMLESGNPAIFTKGIVIEAQDARRTLAEIEARHNDIMKLEASIKELHEMFMDMAMLVESQGEMIDRIEYNVSQSVNYIDSAKTDTRKAVKYQKSARKKKILLCVCLLILIIIIICAIGGFFGLRR